MEMDKFQAYITQIDETIQQENEEKARAAEAAATAKSREAMDVDKAPAEPEQDEGSDKDIVEAVGMESRSTKGRPLVIARPCVSSLSRKPPPP